MKSRTSLIAATACAAAFFLVDAGPAWAVPTAGPLLFRTWVSHHGDNSNDCSIDTPCRTFERAFARVRATGGEIGCLNSGSYGPLLIDHSVTIDCRNVNATIDAIGVGALVIASDKADVTLMGLKLQAPLPNEVGIVASSVHNLTIRDMTIIAGAAGIATAPTGTGGELYVSDTTITGPQYGIAVSATAANQDYRAVFERVHIRDCGAAGIYLTSQSGVGLQLVSLVNSDITNSGAGLMVNPMSTIQRILANVVRSEISYNAIGISATGPRGQVRVRGSTIAGNGNGLQTSGGGAIVTYGDNALYGSTTADGAFTVKLPEQ